MDKFAKLVEELVSFAKEITSQELKEPRELRATITSVLDFLQDDISRAHVEVRINQIHDFKHRHSGLFIVLKNIIANAILYSKGDHQRVEITGMNEGGLYQLMIRDHGLGISENYLSKVFDPFRRLHQSREQDGLGLGLYICKEIMERMGGSIKIKSKINEGTSVTLSIPRHLES